MPRMWGRKGGRGREEKRRRGKKEGDGGINQIRNGGGK